MKITNNHNLPKPMVDALKRSDYTRGESNRSITQLIDSPRYRILKHEYQDEITYDVSELFWMVLGSSVHKIYEDIVEHDDPKWIAEQRFFADIEGWNISGQVDLLERDGDGINLYDYKTTSVWSYIYGNDSYVKQLNCYAALARLNGFKINRLFIVYHCKDWKKRDAEMKPDYPQAPTVCAELPCWDEKQAYEYLRDRILIHQEAEFNRMVGIDLPHCTDEERWKSPTSYAVKKGKNKRALSGSVTDDRAKAEQFIKDRNAQLEADGKKPEDLWVEERTSTPTRCMDYCPVADFCDQYQQELNDE